MYEIKADPRKNRLYIIASGHSTDEELGRAINDVLAAVKTLAQGFDVITDISNMTPVSPKGAEALVRVQAFIKQSGVRHVIRVTAGAPFIKAQFDRTGRDAGYAEGTVVSDTAANIEEAEKILDSLDKKTE